MATKEEVARSISALTALAGAIPGLTVKHLGGERMAAQISGTAGQFDIDLLRRHPLIKQNGDTRVSGASNTICCVECGEHLHLESYFPIDLETLIRASWNNAVPVPA